MHPRVGDLIAIPSAGRFGIAKVLFCSEYFAQVVLLGLFRRSFDAVESPDIAVLNWPMDLYYTGSSPIAEGSERPNGEQESSELAWVTREKNGAESDRYRYPGTAPLKNLLDIQDEEALADAERDLSTQAAVTLEFIPPPYDLDSIKAIHRHLFAEIYPWAGELRSVDISKGQTGLTASRVEPEMRNIFLAGIRLKRKRRHFRRRFFRIAAQTSRRASFSE